MRKALYALAALAIVAAVGAWLAWSSLGTIVAWALEHYGPDVTGTAVHVAEVKISPRDGQGHLRGLEVGNPPGFTAPRAMRLSTARIALDPATLTADVVHVRELVVDGAEITYERGSKVTNLDVIQERISAYVKRLQAADTSSAESPGEKPRADRRRFIVDRLAIRGVHVTITSAGLKGQGLGFDLPDLELSDVGRRRGGLTGSEIAEVVAAALQQRIAQKLLTNLDYLRKGGVEGAIDALKGLLK